MTIYDELLAADLPVQSADENGSISMGAMTEDQKARFRDIILAHFSPAEYTALLAARTDAQALKDQYQAAIDRLLQIENATNPTNAQVIQAIKDIAHYERIITKILARLIT